MTEPRRTTMTIEEELEGDLGTKRMIVNFGPQHPATHGTLRNIIELDGERVVKLEPEIGYLHSGFEKISEYRTYNQTVTVTDRMNYLSPLCNNVGFSLAVEEMMGITVTPRCAAIRVALTGPLLRAAGVPYDVRKARPYHGYENYQFELITEENGDAWCRYRVRVREMRESMKIIDQVLKTMPAGPIYVDDPRIVI